MPELAYKTRGHTDPQGKPRVFFTCHPKDFAACFPTVTEELLAMHNCAIFYTQPGDPMPEEDLLRRMQLIVAPITTRLLTSPSVAGDQILPFAIGCHIPVLPLMQEGNLDALFAKKFGDIQYLDPNQTDLTAIRYSDKLSAFLRGILVADELAEKVRAAFDAYVFLSYRKKDRKYAQQLMKLIHSNDFCRDIAIWYDEFLTPGENFNDAIKDALVKSDLFAMAVTPNLINEANYVMSTEYPMARKLGKTVLPAQLVPTDGHKLSDCYEGIPSSVDASDPRQLADSLSRALREIALLENDSDPGHNFLIGLAYLSGIDVEVDHPRAFRLISSAAEAGCAEAAEKLAAMYRSGTGVGRDYYEAARWQEKLVEIRRQAGDPDALFDALMALCRTYLAISQPEKIRSAYLIDDLEDIIWELERRLQRDARPHRFRLELLKGDMEEARTGSAKNSRYGKALSIAKALAEESPTLHNRRLLARCCIKMGDTCQITQDRKLGITLATSRGIEWYEDAIALSEALVKETGAVEDRRLLSAACEKYGVRCMENRYDDGVSARVTLQKGLSLREALAEETRSPEDRRGLVRLYCAMGLSYKNTSGYSAKDFYGKALSLAEELAVATEALEDRHSVALCCGQLGNAFAAIRRHEEVEPLLRRSVSILEELAELTGAEQEKRALAAGYEQLSRFLCGIGSRREAIAAMERCVSITESLRFMDKDFYLRASQLLRDCGDEAGASGLLVKHAMGRLGKDLSVFSL